MRAEIESTLPPRAGKKNKQWEAPVMAIFSFVQIFISSMILGVVIGDFKLGSSPFILMRDFMADAPVFAMDPNFRPADGTGLNPLLQNYWMVIHPPTLYLGFTAFTAAWVYNDGGVVMKNAQEPPKGYDSLEAFVKAVVPPAQTYTAHSAPMQMAFYDGTAFPADYAGNAFVAMRGSWNRKPPSGYEVIRIDYPGIG